MPSGFHTVGFIGAGRTATALAHAMSSAGYAIAAVSSRSPESARALAEGIPGCDAVDTLEGVVAACDAVLLTVPDDAIAPVAASLPWREGQAAVHCSGALSLEVLEVARQRGAQVGGLHPFQTFLGGREAIPWLAGSTFAIDATGELSRWLQDLAQRLGCKAVTVAAEDRPLYHAAAVLSCGYVTTLLDMACDLWEAAGFSRKEAMEGILPLAFGTLRSIEAQGTEEAATGPIMRADIGTVGRHVEALEERAPGALPLYRQAGISMVDLALKRGAITQEWAHEMRQLLTVKKQGVAAPGER